jgi:hypothetical protein
LVERKCEEFGNYFGFLDDEEGVENIWVGSRVVIVYLGIF